jgi:uncharacterized protein (DUF2141 family)
MKSFILLFILTFFTILQDNSHRLVITVTGLKPFKGDLYISLHNRPEYFQIADSAFMKKKITVNEETENVRFDNVPEGRYAIAIYHDENLNGMMDVNEIGFPREGYGFSTTNKVAGRPKFEQAAFTISRNDTIEVKMIYRKEPVQNKDNAK